MPVHGSQVPKGRFHLQGENIGLLTDELPMVGQLYPTAVVKAVSEILVL
jgi:hypothetical protein